jgi:hypothetical protein
MWPSPYVWAGSGPPIKGKGCVGLRSAQPKVLRLDPVSWAGPAHLYIYIYIIIIYNIITLKKQKKKQKIQKKSKIILKNL